MGATTNTNSVDDVLCESTEELDLLMDVMVTILAPFGSKALPRLRKYAPDERLAFAYATRALGQ